MKDKKHIPDKFIKPLFAGLCCSRCKNDFSENSFEILKTEGDIFICRLICEKCGKDFGEIILNINRHSQKHSALEIIEGPPPINYDDVIDAHRFIKNKLQ